MNDYASNDRPRVIVIDDDPLFRSLITTLLRKEYLVTVASDGAEGYYKAAEYPPDIALIDVQMPGWDGIKTLRHFRSHPMLNKVSLVMLTSDSSRETVMASIEAGAHDYIVKTSFSREDLFTKLARFDPRRKLVMQRVEAQAAGALAYNRSSSAVPATGFATNSTALNSNLPPSVAARTYQDAAASANFAGASPNRVNNVRPATTVSGEVATGSTAGAPHLRGMEAAAPQFVPATSKPIPVAASAVTGTESTQSSYDSRLRELIDDWE